MTYIHNEKIAKNCLSCNKEFLTGIHSKKYCSLDCTHNHNKLKFAKESKKHGHKRQKAGTTGAMHELLASYDLLGRGWNVFRALSPSCHCDLIICKEKGEMFRVEVRTSNIIHDKPSGYSLKGIGEKYDYLASVHHSGKITYFPSLP